jgi:hypothetical protein
LRASDTSIIPNFAFHRADRKVIYLLPNGSGGWKGLSDLGQALLGNQARVPLADNGAIHRITIVLG